MQLLVIGSVVVSDVTGLGRTRQNPNLDYFLQTETRTRLFNINPNQTRVLICDETKYKNPTKNPNPAEPEAKTQPDPKPEPECLNPSRSRTRLFETCCITMQHANNIFMSDRIFSALLVIMKFVLTIQFGNQKKLLDIVLMAMINHGIVIYIHMPENVYPN